MAAVKRGRKREPKGWSLFWRPEKRRWVLSHQTATGWAQKVAPEEITERMTRAAGIWADEFLANAQALGIERKERTKGRSLRGAFDPWILLREANERVSPATAKGNRDHFRTQILPELGDEDVASLATDFSRLKKWFLKVRGRVSASRARNVFSSLKVLFDDAIAEKWIRGPNPLRNEALARELPPLPTTMERGGVVRVPLEHVQAILGSSKVASQRRVRDCVAFTSGDREGELSGLTVENVILEHEVPHLRIVQARRAIRRKGETLGRLKTQTSIRIIPLHPSAVAALREWLEDLENGLALLLRRRPQPDDPVFPSMRLGRGREFARPRSAELLRADLASCELPTVAPNGKNLTAQAARRTFATALERAGVAETDRKRLLGHGLCLTDDDYTDAFLRRLAEGVARIPLTWPGLSLKEEASEASVLPDVVPAAQSESESPENSRSRWSELNRRPAVYESDDATNGSDGPDPVDASKPPLPARPVNGQRHDNGVGRTAKTPPGTTIHSAGSGESELVGAWVFLALSEGVTLPQLQGPGKAAGVVAVRHAAWRAMRAAGYTLEEIARFWGVGKSTIHAGLGLGPRGAS